MLGVYRKMCTKIEVHMGIKERKKKMTKRKEKNETEYKNEEF
jgi:hypothetical protein